MTVDEVRALILSFPGVEDAVSYGEPSFKVGGKFFTWLRPRLDDSIVVHLDKLDEREPYSMSSFSRPTLKKPLDCSSFMTSMNWL